MNTEQLYLIWSIEHDAWWCPLERGYTKERRNAGTYTYAEAKRIVDSANIGDRDVPNEAMIPCRGLETRECECNVGMPRAHKGRFVCPKHGEQNKDKEVNCEVECVCSNEMPIRQRIDKNYKRLGFSW